MISLDQLPTELLNFLLEYLDLPTILFSFRHVCKRFQALVDGFDRQKLDFRSIRKMDFEKICSNLKSEQVRSLVLSDDFNTPLQIQTFLSRFSFEKFTRLKHLKLIQIEENQLFQILFHFPTNSIRTLAIDLQSWKSFSHTVQILLASVINNSNLDKLQLNISFKQIDFFSRFPLPKSLKLLQLERCTLREYFSIITENSNLEKILLRECVLYQTDGTIYQPMEYFSPINLSSLQFGPCFMRLKELFHFLSLTPMLKHLKLIIWTDAVDSVIDASCWEQFISTKLCFLESFKFFFDDLTFVNQTSFNIESYLQPFRTPFWIEEKRWFVACDYVQCISSVRVYSLPVCNSSLNFYSNAEQISSSTMPHWNSKDSIWYDNVQQIHINHTEIASNEETISMIETSFRRVSQLTISINGRSSTSIMTSISKLIDLSNLIRLSLQILIVDLPENESFVSNLESFLTKTEKLESLKLISPQKANNPIPIERLSSMIPKSVKHLQISISNLDEAKCLINQFDQLWSITLHSNSISTFSIEIEKWINSTRTGSSYRYGLHSLQIWLSDLNYNEIDNGFRRLLKRIRRKKSN